MSIELQPVMGISDDACIGCHYDEECKCKYDGEPNCIIDGVNHIYVDLSKVITKQLEDVLIDDRPAIVGVCGVGSKEELAKWWEDVNSSKGDEVILWNGVEIKGVK